MVGEQLAMAHDYGESVVEIVSEQAGFPASDLLVCLTAHLMNVLYITHFEQFGRDIHMRM